VTNKSSLAYLGLGSNLGNRIDFLNRALAQLHCGDLIVTRSSKIYESAPVGPVKDQPAYYNMVAEIRTSLSPVALLHRALAVEVALGRRREIPKGPRTIDIDLLLYPGHMGDWPGLTLPHAEMNQRAFVLLPLLELDKSLTDPRDGRPYAESLRELGDSQPIRPLDVLSPPEYPLQAPKLFADQ